MNGKEKVYANQTTITTTGTSQSLLGPNTRRQGLVISGPLTGRVTISFKGPAVLDQGLTLYATNPPIQLVDDNFGRSVQEEIFCIGSAAGILFSVMETAYG